MIENIHQILLQAIAAGLLRPAQAAKLQAIHQLFDELILHAEVTFVWLKWKRLTSKSAHKFAWQNLPRSLL